MMQMVGLGAPLIEVFTRFFVWLYFPALLFFLIGFRMPKNAVLILVLRQDLQWAARFQLAGRLAFGALQGALVGVLLAIVIYNRKELFQWVTGLF